MIMLISAPRPINIPSSEMAEMLDRKYTPNPATDNMSPDIRIGGILSDVALIDAEVLSMIFRDSR